MDAKPTYQPLLIDFGEGHFAPALSVPKDADPLAIVQHFGLLTPRPSLFLSGGAGSMTDEDMARVRALIEDGIAPFAEEHRLTVVDGGTEAGIMQIMGDVHAARDYKFPLVGIAPHGKVNYPGHKAANSDTLLHDGHTHFVLVESDEWGGESHLLGGLVRAISQRQQRRLGILINGGPIAERDVYFATAQGDDRIPILVVDGTGRKADEISEAYNSGSTKNAVIRAIVQGGKIHLIHLDDGLEALRERLRRYLLP